RLYYTILAKVSSHMTGTINKSFLIWIDFKDYKTKRLFGHGSGPRLPQSIRIQRNDNMEGS
ncbi:hypothetical protein, partial [Desulfobacter postgatei]|uniref:hypothetical protein n=1 Tax=Desulfobacter postgatei TaxID=2293 RepID=UPI002FD91957